ncbi:MAG: TonB-dependent receptor domain-containing protein, partial [Steroidobacteraceae bacterium]
SSPSTPDITKSKGIFKFNSSWHFTPQDNLYFTASQGYRRGGVNDIPTTGFVGENPGWLNFGPDTLNNYELGIKGAHGSYSFNASLFLIDWKDVQLNTATPIWGYYVTANAGKARSQGIELEFRGKFTHALAYGIGYAYTDAKLSEDAVRPYAIAPNPPALIAPSGTRLPAAPTSVINASLDYTFTLHDGHTVVPHIDGYYQSGTFNRLALTPDAAIPLDSYTLWNASVALNASKWSLIFQVRNISNAKAVSGVFTEAQFGSAPADGFAGNTSRELITTPRTMGLIAKYRF